jgi:ABC-type Na+ efflux pump permease subunit/membrane protease YdiL (CAAX protease family)
MKNWLKILKFTLKENLRSSKFITSTVITGIVFLLAVALTNIFVSGAFNKDEQIKKLRTVYIINETDLTLDIDQFVKKHEADYPYLKIEEVPGGSATEAAIDLVGIGDTLILELTDNDENTVLKLFIPGGSNVSSNEGYDFAKEFKETVKNAKIKSTGVSEDKLNMAISDISISEVKAEESDEAEETSIIVSLAPLFVIMVLYFLILIYGQSIGQIISVEKTSKLMEYLLTLSEPSGIVFGKVTAIFCEACIQILSWIACGLTGLFISNSIIKGLTGSNSKNLVSLFIEALPEGGVSSNFVVLLILTTIALLASFLFYSFVSALFASFAATAEELTQTNGMSVMTMLFGFLLSMYVPMFTDNSKLGEIIIRIIPFTSAFVLPGDVLAAKTSPLEFILYFALLLVFTVLLAILTGRIYKNRLFKKGTKGIFEEIISAITGKVTYKKEDEAETEIVTDASYFTNNDSAKKTYTIVGFALLALMLGANVIGGLVGNVIASIVSARNHTDLMSVYEDPMFLTVNNIICMYLIAVPLCALVMKLTDDSRLVVREHISKNQYLRSVFMVFPIAVVLGNFSNFLASKMTGGEAENGINVFLSGDNPLAMLMVAVLAPVFEELVFRKLIIDRTRRYSEMAAIMYSAFAFGLFHCNLYQFFYAFAIGIVLGYVYVRTGNVILTIIIHFILNSTSSILAPLAPQVYEYFSYVMLALGAVSILYTLIKRDVKLMPAKNEVPSKEVSSIAFVNIGSILFIAVCILMMMYNLFAPMLLG